MYLLNVKIGNTLLTSSTWCVIKYQCRQLVLLPRVGVCVCVCINWVGPPQYLKHLHLHPTNKSMKVTPEQNISTLNWQTKGSNWCIKKSPGFRKVSVDPQNVLSEDPSFMFVPINVELDTYAVAFMPVCTCLCVCLSPVGQQEAESVRVRTQIPRVTAVARHKSPLLSA